jgi:glycosyltransferase involved in cell wall biosynthesis
VAIEHWSEINKDTLIPEAKKIGNSTYHHVDQLICVSESLKQMVKKHFNQDSIVVHNMIAKAFCNSNFDSITNKKIQFVATGSLIYRKGFDLLPKAFSMLDLPNEQWELTIIGEGNEYGNLTQQIHSTSLQNNIHLVGIKTKEQIAKILKNSSIFLLPSRNENFSVAVLEALACGLPVIASICGGIRECINETNGLLFPVDDVEKLAQSILYAVQHIDKYDRKAIAEDCQARFSPEVIAKQLTQIFEDTIKKTKNN